MNKKRKITNVKSLQDFFDSQEWSVKTFNESPLPEVTLPPEHMLVVGSGSLNRISNYSGPSIAVAGMDIFRKDLRDYPNVINSDHYSVYSTGDQTLFEIIKDKTGYHWVKSMSEIPESIQASIPQDTKKTIQELLSNNFNDLVGIATKKKK